MTSARDQATVSTDMYDYLDEDEPVRRQNFVCLSFLSPEDVIEDKKLFVMKDFLANFSEAMRGLAGHLRTKFPTATEDIDAIMQTHSTIFKPEEIGADLIAYESINKEALEKSYEETVGFKTNVRGVKVRGSFNTREEAEKHIKMLKSKDPTFDIYLAEVGKWCPWSPCPEEIEDVEYPETQLNTLMKGYKSNIECRDTAYDQDTSDRINRAQPKSSDEATTADN